MPKKRLPEAKQEQKPDCATRSKREKARPIAKRYGKQGFFRSLFNPCSESAVPQSSFFRFTKHCLFPYRIRTVATAEVTL
jgi:hypothetical protein